MEYQEFVNLLKSSPKKLIRRLACKGRIKISGVEYCDIPKNRLLLVVIFCLGNWQIEFSVTNGKKTKISIFYLPLILLALLVEIIVIPFILLFYFGMLLILWPLQRKKEKKIKERSILYLRTDFIGATKEGGSFTHVNGFISGAKKLGWKTTLVASSPFTNCADSKNFIPYLGLSNFRMEIAEMAYVGKLLPKLLPQMSRYSMIYQRHSGFDLTGVILSCLYRLPYVLEVNNLEYWIRKNWGKLYFGPLLRLAEKLIFKKADLIVTVSDVLKNDLIAFGVPVEKILVNPNGVDENIFNSAIDASMLRKKLGFGQNDCVVGFIGSFGVWHGVDVLAKVIPLTIKKNNRIKYLLIGEGELKKSIEELLSSLVKSGQVVFTGKIPHKEAPEYLACCDIFASPHVPNADGSPFFGSPTKLFEYMAMGRAIVASDLEQIGQILVDNRNAILVPPKDDHALASAIISLAKNPSKRKALGSAALKDVIANYTWERNAANAIQQLNITKK